jgi:hypothetical protein
VKGEEFAFPPLGTPARPGQRAGSFEELFCEANRCQLAEFSQKVFWECLYRHALPLAPFLLLFNSRHFDADRQLIQEVRRAERLDQVWEAVRDFFVDPRHAGWLRRQGNIRISGRRLIRLARVYLPPQGVPPPPYPTSKE